MCYMHSPFLVCCACHGPMARNLHPDPHHPPTFGGELLHYKMDGIEHRYIQHYILSIINSQLCINGQSGGYYYNIIMGWLLYAAGKCYIGTVHERGRHFVWLNLKPSETFGWTRRGSKCSVKCMDSTSSSELIYYPCSRCVDAVGLWRSRHIQRTYIWHVGSKV